MRGKFVKRRQLALTLDLASMRPAHYAREVGQADGRPVSAALRFNEARALCAGSCKGRLVKYAVKRLQ